MMNISVDSLREALGLKPLALENDDLHSRRNSGYSAPSKHFTMNEPPGLRNCFAMVSAPRAMCTDRRWSVLWWPTVESIMSERTMSNGLFCDAARMRSSVSFAKASPCMVIMRSSQNLFCLRTGLRSTPTMRPPDLVGPRFWQAIWSQAPGAQPRSRMRFPLRMIFFLFCISSSLKAERAA